MIDTRKQITSIYKWFQTAFLQHTIQQERSQSLTSVLLGGVAASTVAAIVARLLSIVAQVLIARHLGVLLYGRYGTLIATLSLLASLLGLGLDTWLLQEGGRNPGGLSQNLWQVLLLKAIGAIALLALLILAWSNQVTSMLALAVGALGVICDSFTQTGYAVLRAVKRNGKVAIFQIVSSLLVVALLLSTMYRVPPSVLLTIAVQSVCSFAILIALMAQVWRQTNMTDRRFDLVRVIKEAWLFVTADILSNIYSQAGVVILGSAVGDAAVGIFRPALNAIAATYMIPNIIFAVGLPLLSNPSQSRASRSSLIKMMSAAAALYGLTMLIVFWFGGHLLIRTLYGSAFDDVLPILKLICFVPLLKAGSFVASAVLIAYRQQRLRVLLQIGAVALSIGGGLALIPAYGIIGAVWLHIAVEALLFVLYLLGALVVTRQSYERLTH